MYAALTNFLRGNVLLSCTSPMPERLFNLCAAHEIPFWDVRYLSQQCFTLRTSRAGASRLFHAAADVDVTLERLDERGAPIKLHRLRRRYVLLAALLAALVLVWLGNTYIWAFRVTGNKTVPTQDILRALEAQGVTIGTRALDIDQETLRNHILLELHDISWLAVNVTGCTAHVQVVERHRPPTPLPEAEKTNVIASKAGLVTSVVALGGRAMVTKGSTVTAGQLLISGVADSPSAGLRLMQGMGRVYARTWYTLSTLVPLHVTQKGEPVGKTTRFALCWGKQRIKMYIRGSILPPDCDKITVYKPLTLPFGLTLPLTLVQETVTAYAPVTAERTPAQAQHEGEQLLLRQLDASLGDEGSVSSTRFSASRQGDYLLVTLSAECAEQIGVTVAVEQAGAIQ